MYADVGEQSGEYLWGSGYTHTWFRRGHGQWSVLPPMLLTLLTFGSICALIYWPNKLKGKRMEISRKAKQIKINSF